MSDGEGQAPSAAEVGAEKTDYQVWTDAVKESFGPLTDAGLKERDANFAAAVDGRKGEVEGFIKKLLGADADKGGGGEPPQKSSELARIEDAVFAGPGEQDKGLTEAEKRIKKSLKVVTAALRSTGQAGGREQFDALYNDPRRAADVMEFVVDMAAAGVVSREKMLQNFPGLKGMLADLGMGEALRKGAATAEAPRKIDPEEAHASGEILAAGRDLSVFTKGRVEEFGDKIGRNPGDRIKATTESYLDTNLVAGVDNHYGPVWTLDSIPVLRNLKKLR